MSVIFTKQLQTIPKYMGPFCEHLVQTISATQNSQIIEQLSKTNRVQDSFNSILSSISTIGCRKPIESFQLFCEYVPIIDMKIANSPKDTDTCKYFTMFEKTWTYPTYNIIMFYATDLVRAIFLEKMVSQIPSLGSDVLEQLIRFIVDHLLNISYYDDVKEIRKLTLSLYSNSISILSRLIPEICSSIVCDLFSRKELDIRFDFLASLFCDSRIQFFDITKLNDLLSVLTKKYMTSNPDYPLSGRILYNIIGNAFLSNQEIMNTQVIDNIYSASFAWIKKLIYNKYSYCLLSLIHNLRSDPLKDKDDIFITDVLKDANNVHKSGGQFIESLTIFLHGKNFETNYYLDKTGLSFSWKDEKKAKYIDNIYRIVKSHYDLFSKYPKILSDLFLQFEANGKSVFSDIDNKFSPKNIDGFYPYHLTMLRIIFKSFHAFQENSCLMNNACVYSTNGISSLLHGERAPIIFEPTSFTAYLKNSHNVKGIEEVLRSIDTFRSFTFNNRLKSRSIYRGVSKWKKSLKLASDVFPESPCEHDSILLPNIDISDSKYVNLFKIGVLTTCSQQSDGVLYKNIFNSNVELACMAMCSMQMVIHLNQKFAQIFVNNLDQCFPKEFNTQNHLYIIIMALRMILETIVYERIEITQEMNEVFNRFIFFGLCSSHPFIRVYTYEFAQEIKIENDLLFDFKQFLNTKNALISDIAIKHATSIVKTKFDDSNEKNKTVSFSQVIQNNNQYLYVYYCAAFSKVFFSTESLFSNKMHSKLETLLFTIMNSSQVETYFAINLASMYLSFDNASLKNTENIIQYVISRLTLGFANQHIILCGIFSCLGQLHTEPYFELVKCANSSEGYRTLTYILKILTSSRSFMIQNSSESFSKSLSNTLDKIIEFIYSRKLADRDDSSQFLFNDTVIKDKDLILESMLGDFCYCCHKVFEEVSTANSINHYGPFPREKTVDLNFFHPFCTRSSFKLFLSLTNSSNKFSFHKMALRAFTSFMKIAFIPDDIFDSFLSILPKIPDPNGELKSVIFTKFHQALCSRTSNTFFVRSSTESDYFEAIATQFVHRDDFYNKWSSSVSGMFSKQDSEFAEMIFNNSGSLIAIAFSYLENPIARIRDLAFNLIYVLSLSLVLMHYHSQYHSFKSELDKYNATFSNDISGFLLDDMISLSELLEKTIPIISEQFIDQCIKLEQNKQSLSFNISKFNKSTNGSDPNLSINGFDENDSSKRPINRIQTISVFNLIKPNKDESIFAKLVSVWMEKYEFTIEKDRVFKGCAQIFRCFNAFTFIDVITSSFNMNPISSALGKIITTIAESDGQKSIDLLLLIIFPRLLTQKGDHDSNQELIKFLYSIQPQLVIDHFMKYLSFSSWFYYEIQMNKLNNMVDFEKYLQELMQNKNHDEKPEEEEIEYEKVVMITLDLIVCFCQESLQHILPYKAELLSFCQMNKHNDSLKQTISIITKNLTGLSAITNDIFAGLKNEQYNNLITYLRPWFISCGEIQKATEALSIVLSMNYVLTLSEYQALSQSVYVVSQALYERTNGITIKSGFWAFQKLVTGSFTSSQQEIYFSYISQSFQLLKLSPNRDPSLFFYFVSFLKCSVLAKSQLYESVLGLLNSYLDDHNQVLLIKNIVPHDFEGIHNNIHDSISDIKVLNLVFATLHTILKHSMVRLFCKDFPENGIIVCLLPYILSEKHPDVIEEIIKWIESDSILRALQNVSSPSFNLTEFSDLIIEEMGLKISPIVSSIVDFLFCVQHRGTEKHCAVAYSLIRSLIKFDFVQPSNIKVSRIISSALNNNDVSLTSYIEKLIKEAMSKNVKISPAKNSKSSSNFPLISVPSIFNIKNWKPSNSPDIFQNPDTIPPIFITDPALITCPIFTDLKFSIEQIKSPEFSNWYEMLYKSQISYSDGFGASSINNADTIMIKNYDQMKNIKSNIDGKAVNTKTLNSTFKQTPITTFKSFDAMLFLPPPESIRELIKDYK